MLETRGMGHFFISPPLAVYLRVCAGHVQKLLFFFFCLFYVYQLAPPSGRILRISTAAFLFYR
jgi:hypothetical protein